jgi:hypothetical protein
LLAPPRNLVPVFLLGAIAVGGAATAIVAGVVFKGQAQDNANQTESAIRMALGNMDARAFCNNTALLQQRTYQGFVQPCADLANDIDDVNVDATIGNIGLGVGIAAAAGGLLYWLFAAKGPSEPTDAMRPIVAPSIGRSSGGLTVVGQF